MILTPQILSNFLLCIILIGLQIISFAQPGFRVYSSKLNLDLSSVSNSTNSPFIRVQSFRKLYLKTLIAPKGSYYMYSGSGETRYVYSAQGLFGQPFVDERFRLEYHLFNAPFAKPVKKNKKKAKKDITIRKRKGFRGFRRFEPNKKFKLDKVKESYDSHF